MPLPTPGYVATPADLSQSHAPFSAMPSTTGNNGSSSSSANPPVPIQILHVNSQSLEELFLEINCYTLPTVFDLGGQTFDHKICIKHPADIILTASNITIRNGTIHHSNKNGRHEPGLHVRGENVRLECLTIIGGGWGVLILPTSSAKILNCVVTGCCYGVGVGHFFGLNSTPGAATLEMENAKVSQCTDRGLSVGIGGTARVKRGEIFDNYSHGMWVKGDRSSVLVASGVHCHGNKKRGLCVSNQGSATIFRCNILHNIKGSIMVEHQQSIIKHDQCMLDAHPEVGKGGVISAVSMP